jgi:hypothetical protein
MWRLIGIPVAIYVSLHCCFGDEITDFDGKRHTNVLVVGWRSEKLLTIINFDESPVLQNDFSCDLKTCNVLILPSPERALLVQRWKAKVPCAIVNGERGEKHSLIAVRFSHRRPDGYEWVFPPSWPRFRDSIPLKTHSDVRTVMIPDIEQLTARKRQIRIVTVHGQIIEGHLDVETADNLRGKEISLIPIIVGWTLSKPDDRHRNRRALRGEHEFMTYREVVLDRSVDLSVQHPCALISSPM